MRFIQRLSPFAHVAGAVGLLLILASIAISTSALIASTSTYPHIPADNSRMQLVSMNLGMLGAAAIPVLIADTLRRDLERRPLSRVSWQNQIRTIILLAVLPLCALALTLIAPPSRTVYEIAGGISYVEAFVLLIALFALIVRRLPAR